MITLVFDFIGNPSPGTPGGGAPPNNVGISAIALSLVPPGLVAVAVFPPYETPRTVPAISVIFAENPTARHVYKFFILLEHRHDCLFYFRLREKRSLSTTFQTFMKNLKCLRTRLDYRFARKIRQNYPRKREIINRYFNTDMYC